MTDGKLVVARCAPRRSAVLSERRGGALRPWRPLCSSRRLCVFVWRGPSGTQAYAASLKFVATRDSTWSVRELGAVVLCFCPAAPLGDRQETSVCCLRTFAWGCFQEAGRRRGRERTGGGPAECSGTYQAKSLPPCLAWARPASACLAASRRPGHCGSAVRRGVARCGAAGKVFPCGCWLCCRGCTAAPPHRARQAVAVLTLSYPQMDARGESSLVGGAISR